MFGKTQISRAIHHLQLAAGCEIQGETFCKSGYADFPAAGICQGARQLGIACGALGPRAEHIGARRLDDSFKRHGRTTVCYRRFEQYLGLVYHNRILPPA